MDLSIVIVNWNSKDFLRDCLTTLYAHTQGLKFEVIVIDSASFDGAGGMLDNEFPQVRFIQSNDNLGFAKANNVASHEATGDYILFLNPDTEVHTPAIQTLCENLRSLPEAGVLGARLLNTDGSIQTSAIQAFPNLLNQLFNLEFLRQCFPKAKLWGTAALYATDHTPQEVDVVCGACMLMRREVFEKIGRFTEAYFMYSEDVDLCYKVKAAGLKTYYVPSARIVHHGGSSSAQSEAGVFSSVMMMESRWRYFCRTRSIGYSILFRLGMMLSSLARLSALLLGWPVGLLFAKGKRFRAAFRKWWSRLQWTLGLNRWVKKYGV